jgi:type I restriction enzyme, S subunit
MSISKNEAWDIFPIKELCLGIYDGPHATPEKTLSGPVFLGISSLSKGRIDLSKSENLSEDNFKKWTRRITPQSNDVVFSYETRLGEAALIPEGLRCCLGRRMALMRPNLSKVDPQFLLYAYLSPEFQNTVRERTIHGSTVDRILLTEFPEYPITVPPLPEQKAIARILGALDDKIELNQKMNQTLEAMAQAIFKSWFVDFDPVRAKMAGQQPVGMDEATAALFPDSIEDSVLGEIPKGWTVSTIGESVKVFGGSTPSTKNPAYWDGGNIHWATPKILSSIENHVLLSTERKITDLGLKEISSGLLPKGTVLLSSRAPIGYLVISEIPVAVNQGFIAMVCNQQLSNHYVLHWTKENMNIIKGRANGTTFMEISKSNFRSIELIVPEPEILESFTKKVSLLHEKVVSNLQESANLCTLRDTLLPKLMSGELRVPEGATSI